MTFRHALLSALSLTLSVFALNAQVIPGRFILELPGEPAATYSARQEDKKLAARLRREAIAIEQQRLRNAVEQSEGRVLGSADTVANALFVELPSGSVNPLSRLPGVLRVHRVYRVRALLNRALPIHKVGEAWARIGGSDSAGKGMKIGIVDTGIDQAHIGFDMAVTMPEGFPKFSSEANRALIKGKVIVARSYEDIGGAGYEPDAADRNGHGTNAAFAAAGVRLQLEGGQLSGTAPAAYLGNYKALGADGGGSNDVIIKAIDDAVKDGMDVINLSLGSDITSNPDTDLQVKAVEAAVEAGAIVVIAAGNAGPDENTINSPGTAPSGITVGSSSNDRQASDNAPLDPKRVSDFSSRGPNLGQGLKPDMLAVGDNFYTADSSLKPGASQITNTQGTSFAAPVIAGAAALLKAARPGLPTLVYRSLLVNSSSPLLYESGQPAPIRFAGAGRLNMDAALQATVAAAPTSFQFGTGGPSVNLTKELTLGNAGTAAADFELAVVAFPGPSAEPVLSATRLSIAAGTTGTVQIQFQGNNLPAGEYQGMITVRASNSPVLGVIPYWYAVTSDEPASITILDKPDSGDPGGQPTFGVRVLDKSGIALNVPITVTPVCGGEVTSVADNDPDYPGVYAVQAKLGTTLGSNVFRIAAGSARRYVTVNLNGELDSSTTYIPACGITNGASFIAGDVAAGSFASIFGNRLAGALVQNSQVPLATELGGTSVAINGVNAPLFFVSPGQINFQVPYEAAAGPATATVTVGGTALPPVPFTVSATAPGILQFGENRAVAVNQNGSINNSNNPAPKGSTIVLYGTGQGALDNAVPSGNIAPASGDPLSRPTAEVRVIIGGTPVQPLFAGLTPGFVGLLQVNLVIPQLEAGTYPMVLAVGGVQSKPVLITVQ
ncbi:MAG: S8 family serine peptidase [Bryobacter sp.]|nr:S8 family serine peptidase [Bryobacter sp.]